MGGKAKFTKHTAKSLAAKQDQRSRGGGKEGTEARTNVKLGFTCSICKSASPDIKSFEAHYTNKHPKAEFNRDDMISQAEALRASITQSKHVKGSHHKK